MEVLQNLDQGFLEARYLKPVLDAADQADWINFWADVLEQAADER